MIELLIIAIVVMFLITAPIAFVLATCQAVYEVALKPRQKPKGVNKWNAN